MTGVLIAVAGVGATTALALAHHHKLDASAVAWAVTAAATVAVLGGT